MAGGREEEEVQLSLTVSCGRKYLSFFPGFSRQKPENHNVDLLSMPFKFFKTLDNYVTSKPTHPTLSIWVLLLLAPSGALIAIPTYY